MKIQAITFDCAGTLVKVNYDPAALALDCARDCGLAIDESEAAARYARLLQTRWAHYVRLNFTGTDQDCDAFWKEITVDWLQALGLDTRHADLLVEAAHARLYGENSPVFSLYEDALPCVEAVLRAGYRIGVLSNWDYSLPRVLRSLGIYDRFEFVVASLVEGVEKPDPRLFGIAASRFGLQPGEIVHVGDCPYDDLHGARQAGFRGVLLDRGQPGSGPGRISSLSGLLEAVEELKCC